MSRRRVIRVLSYEGNSDWMFITLHKCLVNAKHAFFCKHGTIIELQRIELTEDEELASAITVKKRDPTNP